MSLEHEILEFLLETWSIKTLIKLAELCTVLYDRAMSRGHYFTTPPPPTRAVLAHGHHTKKNRELEKLFIYPSMLHHLSRLYKRIWHTRKIFVKSKP